MSGVMTLSGTLEMYSQFPNEPEDSPLSERFIVVGLVVLLHLLVFASYFLQPESPAVLVNEMSISFANMQMQQADIAPQPKPKPREPEPEPAEELAPKEEPVLQDAATPESPVVLDAEPDYRADYLNNPKPPYPRVASRMGYHGKVVLDVEVLPEGIAGDIKLHQSSGYDILDNAAIQTVKTWRFSPGRLFGQVTTRRILVPIRFSLEDGAT